MFVFMCISLPISRMADKNIFTNAPRSLPKMQVCWVVFHDSIGWVGFGNLCYMRQVWKLSMNCTWFHTVRVYVHISKGWFHFCSRNTFQLGNPNFQRIFVIHTLYQWFSQQYTISTCKVWSENGSSLSWAQFSNFCTTRKVAGAS